MTGQGIALYRRFIYFFGVNIVFGYIAQQAGLIGGFQQFQGCITNTGGRGIAFQRSAFAGARMQTSVGDDDRMTQFTGKAIMTINKLAIWLQYHCPHPYPG